MLLVTELWQGLKIKQKQAIRALADITAQPIYRTQETGTIFAKLVLAFAQSLNVNPFYLTGEADEPGECTDGAIRELLIKYGYRGIVASMGPAKRKYERHVKPDVVESPVDESTEEDVPVNGSPIASAPQLPPSSDALTVEDLQQLVFALYVQAKAGIANAKEKLDQIKLIILSESSSSLLVALTDCLSPKPPSPVQVIQKGRFCLQ